ncbi:MAG TPA: hypothetical protein VK492_01465 [Chitinophagaceae bacterium]|nr:hypothetical protein [Chitinophagaceae bacterium]
MIQIFINRTAVQAFCFSIAVLFWKGDHQLRTSVKLSVFNDQPSAEIFRPASIKNFFPDTVNLPNMATVEQKIRQLKILGTPSAYELFYQLNPGLKQGKYISESLIKTPSMPVLMDMEINDFYSQFERDTKKDEELQKVLADSIRYCLSIFEDMLYGGGRVTFTKQDDRDRIQRLGGYMYSDLRMLVNEDVARVKAIELIKLLNGCYIIFDGCKQKRTMTPEDVNTVYYIGRQVSYIINSENLRRYYSESEMDGNLPKSPYQGHGPFHQPGDIGKSSTFAIGGLKPFSVAIYLSKNGKVISDGPDVKKRYRVMCYPPALIGFEPTRRDCDSPATFAYITLSKAPYAFCVVDLRTGKKMKFVKDNKENEIISTETAFDIIINQRPTLPPLFQIALYIKED